MSDDRKKQAIELDRRLREMLLEHTDAFRALGEALRAVREQTPDREEFERVVEREHKVGIWEAEAAIRMADWAAEDPQRYFRWRALGHERLAAFGFATWPAWKRIELRLEAGERPSEMEIYDLVATHGCNDPGALARVVLREAREATRQAVDALRDETDDREKALEEIAEELDLAYHVITTLSWL